MNCPYCNQEHPDGYKFCPNTGKAIDNQFNACTNEKCPDFGKYILPLDSKFCPKCGSPIKASEQIYTTTNRGDDTIIFKVNGVSFSMIKVEAGSFLMGDDENIDAPSHEVSITHDYYIGKTVVTNELALAILTDKNVVSEVEDEFGCLDEDDIDEMEDNPNLPLVNVSWNNAKSLIRILKKITGENFNLPTEAEWEFAARGGNKSENYSFSGSDDLDDVAWYAENSDFELQEVASKEPNELGIYDMSGLIGEWCSDWYDEDYYDNSPKNNPRGPKKGDTKVIRGGSISLEDDCGVCWRGDHNPYRDHDEIGFRFVFRVRK